MAKLSLLFIFSLLCVGPSSGQPLQGEHVSPPRGGPAPSCGMVCRTSPLSKHNPWRLHTTISAARLSKSPPYRNLGSERVRLDSSLASRKQAHRNYYTVPANFR